MTQHPNSLSRRQLLVGGTTFLGVVSLGGLAACGDDDGGGAASNPKHQGADGGPRRGGTLRFGYSRGSSDDTLDIHHGSNDFEIAAGLQMHAGLVRIRDGELIMGLAEEIDLESPTTVTVRLREGLEFHNGKTITAHDVLASFARILDPENPGLAAGRIQHIDLDASRAVDDRTVRLELLKPDVFIAQSLATSNTAIYPDGGWDEQARIGAGPFKVTQFVPGTSVEYERFENYWDDGPYVDALTIQNFADPTALVNALNSGAIDLAGDVPATQARTLGGDIQVLQGPTGGFAPFVMNTSVPPFDDVRVRQAFRLLVDRDGMITQLQDGLGTVGNDLYSPLDPAFIGDQIQQREQDIEQAKALLREAGAEDLRFTMGVSGFVNNAEVVLAEQARTAGVTIDVEQVDQTTYYTQHYAQDPIYMSFWPALPYALQTKMSMVPGADYPEGNWTHDRFIQLFDDASADLDESSRNEKLAEMQRIYHDEGPYLIWGFEEQTDAAAGKVAGTIQDGSGFPFGNFDFTTTYFAEA